MRRAWHTVARAVLIGAVLFPIWLGYFWPWFRETELGERVEDEEWAALHRRFAARFYWLAVKMRGGLIKVGQIISTRVDVLPIEWTSGLARLQDQVTPTSWEVISAHLAEELGGTPDEVFASIERDAINAASFGQVHRAVTRDGREVALKIKYPDVEFKLAVDMWLFAIAVRLFNVFIPRIRLAPIYDEIRRALSTELDYETEADFTRRIHRNFEGREGVRIPAVVDEHTTRNVICTTWVPGVKITSPEVLGHPKLDKTALLERVLSTWISMMYVDGVFQSDPHPGNLLVDVQEDGTPILGVVDFGQVKVLPENFHQTLVRSVMMFAMGDVSQFVDTLTELGLFPASEKHLAQPIVNEVIESLKKMDRDAPLELDFSRLRDEVRAAIDRIDGIVIPHELVLYGRTFALLAGVTRSVQPHANPLLVARPILMQALLAA